MRVAIVGSRTYSNTEAVRSYVESLPSDTIVVTGGWPSHARGYRVIEATAGVDREAYVAAERCGLVTVVCAGSRTKHKHMAGVQRNPVIVDLSEAVVAFWDLESRGTARTLRLSLDRRLGILVIGPDGVQVPHWREFLPSNL